MNLKKTNRSTHSMWLGQQSGIFENQTFRNHPQLQSNQFDSNDHQHNTYEQKIHHIDEDLENQSHQEDYSQSQQQQYNQDTPLLINKSSFISDPSASNSSNLDQQIDEKEKLPLILTKSSLKQHKIHKRNDRSKKAKHIEKKLQKQSSSQCSKKSDYHTNIPTVIAKSAAQHFHADPIVQNMIKQQCNKNNVPYQSFIHFIQTIHQQGYISLAKLHQLISPRSENSCQNIFKRYFSWFLSNKYIQKLSNSDVKHKKLYIDYKNRILLNLQFHQPKQIEQILNTNILDLNKSSM